MLCKVIKPDTIVQFIKFGIVGFSNTAISYLIYFVLVYFGLHYIAASIIAFIISVLNSFFWNNKYVFKRNKDQKRSIIHSLIKTYISYAFTGLILQNILLFLFIDILHISKYLAPFFGLVITIPLNFILNKIWAFRSVKHDKDESDEENQRVNTLL
jgi:putative flippase GtrA